jgi:hypothetical protein
MEDALAAIDTSGKAWPEKRAGIDWTIYSR